ncbi:MAG TPA: lytic murein transglycosylase [Vicinamibacterales bacterium]|nr:lytic murein transglycosylase [Vicinamibacterales bacterium]
MRVSLPLALAAAVLAWTIGPQSVVARQASPAPDAAPAASTPVVDAPTSQPPAASAPDAQAGTSSPPSSVPTTQEAGPTPSAQPPADVRPGQAESLAPKPETFEHFLSGVRAEALVRGVGPATLDLAFTGLTPEPVVVSRDRTQPEETQSLEDYVARHVTPRTIAAANRMRRTHRALLTRIERAYGVAPAPMVAIWGLESNFGAFTGTYPTIRALATLAYDARRPLFREELLNALAILNAGHVDPTALKGSWAGAMGQPQFMPSSFLKYAVDFDKNGRIDIWTSTPDVLASMANYLKAMGWKTGERWGREVKASKSVLARIDRDVPMRTTGCRALRQMTEPRPLTEWRTLGVRLANGRPLPASSIKASLIRGERRLFLGYTNYDALVAYNCSNSYAVAVGLLSDEIR